MQILALHHLVSIDAYCLRCRCPRAQACTASCNVRLAVRPPKAASPATAHQAAATEIVAQSIGRSTNTLRTLPQRQSCLDIAPLSDAVVYVCQLNSAAAGQPPVSVISSTAVPHVVCPQQLCLAGRQCWQPTAKASTASSAPTPALVTLSTAQPAPLSPLTLSPPAPAGAPGSGALVPGAACAHATVITVWCGNAVGAPRSAGQLSWASRRNAEPVVFLAAVLEAAMLL